MKRSIEGCSTIGCWPLAAIIALMVSLSGPQVKDCLAQPGPSTSPTPSTQADPNTSDTSSGSAASPGAGSATGQAQSPALKGSVQIIELNLQMLRDVGLDLKKVISAAGSLYDEVTLQPVTVTTMPNVIGMGTVWNIPVGFNPSGPPLPPRKKRVDLAMNEMRPIITLLKSDVDDVLAGRSQLDLSDTTRQQLDPQFKQWVKTVDDINAQLKALEPLTQGPTYDNGAIASAASAINQDTRKLEKLRKQIYKVIQREGRRKKGKAA